MSTQLLDAFGRPAEYLGVSAGPYESPSIDGMHIPPPPLTEDMAAMLPRYKHRAMLSDSRYIAGVGGFPLVSFAIEQKAQYVNQAGWTPVFTGKNHDWGKRMRALLVETHKLVNVRGPLYHWDKTWKIASTWPDIDGDGFILLGKTPTGFPKIQCLEAHRIGSRYGECYVSRGTYEGLLILNGIIYNAYGQEVAYRVLGNTYEQDRDVSARDMLHVCDPRWMSDGRPFPTVAYAIRDWYSIGSARSLQHLKQRVNSALTIVETTPDGKPAGNTMADALRKTALASAAAKAAATAAGQPAPAEPLRPGSPGKPLVEILSGGLIRYVKSGAGDIKSHADTSPGSSWLDFDGRVGQGAFAGMGWRSEMLDLSKLSGAPTRGFADQINTTIYDRWKAIAPFVHRVELHLIAAHIDRGDIEDSPEWAQWGYIPPADFTVDNGRAGKTDIDNVRAGIDSRPYIIGRYGRTAEEVLDSEGRYRQLQAEKEKEYHLAPGSLANLDQPGLSVPGSQPEQTQSPASAPPIQRAP